MDVQKIAQTARQCSVVVAHAGRQQKDAALRAMADRLMNRKDDIVAANQADLDAARAEGVPDNLVKRLAFDEQKIASRVTSLGKIEALADPVGQTYKTDLRPNGLRVARVRVPLGVILMIFEARPHVTVNAGAFCLKSGNAAILRGGSEARRCNELIGTLWRESLAEAGLPAEAVQVVSGSHEEVDQLLRQEEYIDLVIPRGGKGLIQSVAAKSRIPVVKHYAGVCHVYVGQNADTRRALGIVLDSKLLMPAVCNAAETVLVDASLRWWVPLLVSSLADNGVEVRGGPQVCADVPGTAPATEEDWATEYLDLIYSVKLVDGVEEAAEHIRRYGSGHTDSIVTESCSDAQQFVREVDSGVVLVNASTMFCDGESLGMGAEIGISTDKLHARGPMGLEELTSYKHVIVGEGHTMGDYNP